MIIAPWLVLTQVRAAGSASLELLPVLGTPMRPYSRYKRQWAHLAAHQTSCAPPVIKGDIAWSLGFGADPIPFRGGKTLTCCFASHHGPLIVMVMLDEMQSQGESDASVNIDQLKRGDSTRLFTCLSLISLHSSILLTFIFCFAPVGFTRPAMLSRLRRRDAGPPPDPRSVNHTREHSSLAKTIARRRRIFDTIWSYIPLLRVILTVTGVLWLLALPYEGLWKSTYIDEHALQPAQVTMYFDWAEVHKADLFLGELENIVNSSFVERSHYLQNTFSASGLDAGSTRNSTYAHVNPPRSAGTETILLSANWISRDGGPNLRGIATLLAFGDFLKGQNHWAFDFVLVIGDGYMSGLEDFMQSYHSLFPGVIWTALNIDYPGHSFSHIGLFYEGVNGRLPNQDVVNTVSHVARHAGGVLTRFHDIRDEPPRFGPEWYARYLLAAKHLLHHFAFMALGRPSAAHGVLARHRIDSLTLYASPATGPHGFHTLGRTLESTLRSFNNLLERLHASYFFYLFPRPERFIPVGNYLPAAILLGASLTIGGFDCPDPLGGLSYLARSFAIAGIAFMLRFPLLAGTHILLPRPKGDTKKSVVSLALLLFGAIIPTLAMINFPQSILLALLAHLYLTAPYPIRLILLAFQPGIVLAQLKGYTGIDLEAEWRQVGNLAYVGLYAVVLPLWDVAALLLL